jgi:myo-inositol-hexaphosphate 3-phosphohydrolase
MSFRENLGLKSYSFNEFEDNRAVAAAVKSCGVRGIDLSGRQAKILSPGSMPLVTDYAECT